MAIAGRLANMSFAEVLQILDRGKKTGLLSLQVSPDGTQQHLHYIWFSQGRIVAAADRTDGAGLASMLVQRKWLDASALSQLDQIRKLEAPLGAHLKAKGVLQAEQLKLLFHAQVLQRVCTLFKFRDGDFQFDAQVISLKSEMTGLSVSIPEAILLGLRALRDWESLEDKLPQPHLALSKSILDKLTIQLDATERQTWDLAYGALSVQDVAQRLSLPLRQIQQAAFRLIAVGLVEEVPVDSTVPKLSVEKSAPVMLVDASEQPPVTRSFLKDLLGFLRSKV
jgi:Domain of unknown function (DUF4388)